MMCRNFWRGIFFGLLKIRACCHRSTYIGRASAMLNMATSRENGLLKQRLLSLFSAGIFGILARIVTSSGKPFSSASSFAEIAT